MRPEDEIAVADRLLAAFDEGRQIAPLTGDHPDLSLAEGYAIAAMNHARRLARGEAVAGRKIGFTNRMIWPIYNVHAPVWGYMYAASTHPIPTGGAIPLPALPECRIEPEIAFRFAATPAPDMDDAALAACIDAVAHGVEIVWSPYPDWRFTAPDSVAAFAMHGAFWYGPPQPAAPLLADGGTALADMTLTLTGPTDSQTGHGTDVLGGPIKALRRLIEELPSMPGATPIQPGEWVTTGTLTDARPVTPGETWETRIQGVPLPGLRLTFTGSA
jgi:2-oxo-3-hexenedioate decarboxylase